MREMTDVVLGIDNGFANTKSENTLIRSGVRVSDIEPRITREFFRLDGKYIVFGESVMQFQSEKTLSEEHYYLTIAAMLKELQYRDITDASVILGVGLPISWCSRENKDKLKKYLQRKPDLSVCYDDTNYYIRIKDVFVFPQGFAGVTGRFNLTGRNLVVDIGSGTIDTIMIVDNKPREESVDTAIRGVRILREEIRKEISKIMHTECDDDIIESFLIKGCNGSECEEAKVIYSKATEYCSEIIKYIKNKGFRPGISRAIIIGGGAQIMQNFSDVGSVKDVVIVNDISINARGYANLAQKVLEMQKEVRI